MGYYLSVIPSRRTDRLSATRMIPKSLLLHLWPRRVSQYIKNIAFNNRMLYRVTCCLDNTCSISITQSCPTALVVPKANSCPFIIPPVKLIFSCLNCCQVFSALLIKILSHTSLGSTNWSACYLYYARAAALGDKRPV